MAKASCPGGVVFRRCVTCEQPLWATQVAPTGWEKGRGSGQVGQHVPCIPGPREQVGGGGWK